MEINSKYKVIIETETNDIVKHVKDIVFYYMHDNFTFSKIEIDAPDKMINQYAELIKKSPYGMLCKPSFIGFNDKSMNIYNSDNTVLVFPHLHVQTYTSDTEKEIKNWLNEILSIDVISEIFNNKLKQLLQKDELKDSPYSLEKEIAYYESIKDRLIADGKLNKYICIIQLKDDVIKYIIADSFEDIVSISYKTFGIDSKFLIRQILKEQLVISIPTIFTNNTK